MPKPTANKKPAFGGYAINFQGRSESLESLFGSAPIGPAEMTKKLWSYGRRRAAVGAVRRSDTRAAVTQRRAEPLPAGASD
jgi:hypothetical protein